MAGIGEGDRAGVGIEHQVDQRGHLIQGKSLDELMQPPDDVDRGVLLDRVGAEGHAQLGHGGRGPEPVAGNVTDRHADLPVRQLQHVL